MLKRLTIYVLLAGCVGDQESSNRIGEKPMSFGSVAERLHYELDVEALPYGDSKYWGCAGKTGVCAEPVSMESVATDGTQANFSFDPAPEPAIDCFYVYPTMDWSLDGGNVMDLPHETAREVILSQAAPFASACRVFAPFYRQAKLGTYFDPPEVSAHTFKLALFDVATAFEHYLANWNQGRPVVIFGHSQGAQLSSYLLHMYFDGARQVSRVEGSKMSNELRERLVVALPLGFNVFVPQGELVGGSFSDLPLCSKAEETGCVIHYRSYPEGFVYDSIAAAQGPGDQILSEEGFLHRQYDPKQHQLACVNPALGEAPADGQLVDGNGKPVPVDGSRVISFSTMYRSFTLQEGLAAEFLESGLAYPRRYAATCRGDGWLAIGLYESPEGDTRGDPIGITGYRYIANGMHVWDYHVALGDLVEQVKLRGQAWIGRQQ